MINVSNEMCMKRPVIIGFNFNSLGNFLSVSLSRKTKQTPRNPNRKENKRIFYTEVWFWNQFEWFIFFFCWLFSFALIDCCCACYSLCNRRQTNVQLTLQWILKKNDQKQIPIVIICWCKKRNKLNFSYK